MFFNNPLTIEQIEQKYNVKLTYPFQSFDNIELTDELQNYGCSDILTGKGGYIHKDCRSNCENCNFFPIKKKYHEDNNIPYKKVFKIKI